MNNQSKLVVVKLIHTAIWIFFNIIIAYMLFASITGRLGWQLWTCYILVGTEGVVLLVFRFVCPLTILASRYTKASTDNFDIYLPIWLARYTKLIYTSLTLLIIVITVYQLLKQ